MAQIKAQIKAPKIELSNEERANLSDTEFKTLVLKRLTEVFEYGCKMEEKVRVMQSEIKKYIYREPTVKGRKQGLKSTVWDRRRNKQSTRTE